MVNVSIARIVVAAIVISLVGGCAASDDPEGFCRRFRYLDGAIREGRYGFTPATLRLAVNADYLGNPGAPLAGFLENLMKLLYEMDFEGRVDVLGDDRSVLRAFQEQWQQTDRYCNDTFAL